MLSLHDAVLKYVIEKTFRKAPYEKFKEFDVRKTITDVLAKKQISEYDDLSYGNLFQKGNK